MADLKERYSVMVPMKIGSQTEYIEGVINAKLTDESWDFFGDCEELMQKNVYDSPWQDLALPTMTRMAGSMMKMAMLIAASRRQPSASNTLVIELSDFKQAAYYIQKWGQYSLELVMASGKSSSEKIIEKALAFISAHTDGVTQSQLMQRFHMSSKEMREIRDTLVDRGLCEINQKGRGFIIKAVHF